MQTRPCMFRNLAGRRMGRDLHLAASVFRFIDELPANALAMLWRQLHFDELPVAMNRQQRETMLAQTALRSQRSGSLDPGSNPADANNSRSPVAATAFARSTVYCERNVSLSRSAIAQLNVRTLQDGIERSYPPIECNLRSTGPTLSVGLGNSHSAIHSDN